MLTTETNFINQTRTSVLTVAFPFNLHYFHFTDFPCLSLGVLLLKNMWTSKFKQKQKTFLPFLTCERCQGQHQQTAPGEHLAGVRTLKRLYKTVCTGCRAGAAVCTAVCASKERVCYCKAAWLSPPSLPTLCHSSPCSSSFWAPSSSSSFATSLPPVGSDPW